MTTTTYITNGGSAVRTSGHLNEPSYMGLCCFRTSLNSYPQIIDFLSRGGPARCLMDYWVVPIPFLLPLSPLPQELDLPPLFLPHFQNSYLWTGVFPKLCLQNHQGVLHKVGPQSSLPFSNSSRLIMFPRCWSTFNKSIFKPNSWFLALAQDYCFDPILSYIVLIPNAPLHLC